MIAVYFFSYVCYVIFFKQKINRILFIRCKKHLPYMPSHLCYLSVSFSFFYVYDYSTRVSKPQLLHQNFYFGKTWNFTRFILILFNFTDTSQSSCLDDFRVFIVKLNWTFDQNAYNIKRLERNKNEFCLLQSRLAGDSVDCFSFDCLKQSNEADRYNVRMTIKDTLGLANSNYQLLDASNNEFICISIR